MTAAWDGRPEQPERTRPHELWNLPHNGGGGPTFWTWDADAQLWTLGFYMKHPEDAAKAWRYVGPCLTPAEVAAQVAARAAAAERRGIERAAEVTDCGCKIRDAVLARLESKGEKYAGYLCPHGDACCALQAAAIRALLVEGER